MKFSVQLYSLRDLVKDGESFLALFPKLKALGFDGVEFAGYHGLSAEEIRKALDDAGLVATGCHMGLNDLKPENLPATIAFCKTLGMDMIGIGGAPHVTARATAKSCAVLKKAYKAALPQGMTVYYHNHSGEFKAFRNGVMAIDMFKDACALQVDTYWSFCAGADNYKFLMENRDRICGVHIKDGKGREGRALGEGECDLATVVRAAREIGLEWLVLEDESRGDQMESVAKGARWLRANA
ncbi:MAG: sugar phosphate isomerase/epimerase [Oscillospiraceae bacterium]|jgi:sugar phosphate isomerase/epimerase|nr:sugar phosphate isomerase/epimerase [Oscillospiraceae bacterium]